MSIAIHRKTGKVYIIKKLFAENCTNGFEYERYTIYKRPFKKKIYVRRVSEFVEKFCLLNEWIQEKCQLGEKTNE